jgi:hypothetical protein
MTIFPPPPPPRNTGRGLLTAGAVMLILGLSGVWNIETNPEPTASVGYLVITPVLFVGGVLLFIGGVTWFTQRRSGQPKN